MDEAQQRVGTDAPLSKDGSYVDSPFNSDKRTGYGLSGDRDRDEESSFLHRLNDNLGEVAVESGSQLVSEVRVSIQGKSENSVRSANVEFLHTASKEGLRIISLGMEKAIGKTGNPSGQENYLHGSIGLENETLILIQLIAVSYLLCACSSL